MMALESYFTTWSHGYYRALADANFSATSLKNLLRHHPRLALVVRLGKKDCSEFESRLKALHTRCVINVYDGEELNTVYLGPLDEIVELGVRLTRLTPKLRSRAMGLLLNSDRRIS